MDGGIIDLASSDIEDSVITAKAKNKNRGASKSRKISKSKTPPIGTCVFTCDVGLKNLAICVMEQQGNPETGALTRPKIREWRNTNLYAEREGGKIIKYEAADKLILRIRDHFDDVGKSLNDWKDVSQVGIESQAASTNAIRRAEAFIFAYFVYKHPHIQVKSISASYKLKLAGMTHSKNESQTYIQRKNLAIKYGREYMTRAPLDCKYRHFAEKPARKKRGEDRAVEVLKSDVFDAALMGLHMLGLPITI